MRPGRARPLFPALRSALGARAVPARTWPSRARRVAAVLAVAVTAGCATGERAPPVADGPHDAVIAHDLALALALVLPPRRTTLQLSRDRDEAVGDTLSEALLEAGFGVQRVDDDQGTRLVAHARTPGHDRGDRRGVAHTLAVGSLVLGRDYSVGPAGEVWTAGPIRVSSPPPDPGARPGGPPTLVVADAAHARFVVDGALEAPAGRGERRRFGPTASATTSLPNVFDARALDHREPDPVHADAAAASRLGGDTRALAELSVAERRALALVATDLVAALVQVPGLHPLTTTLQIAAPTSAFGNLVARALEDAGYGLQRVAADQGDAYVRYSRRFAETDSGPVEDFTLSVGPVALAREYVSGPDGAIYPASPLLVDGGEDVPDILVDARPFREQGGDDELFVSGAVAVDAEAGAAELTSVRVGSEDARPPARRVGTREVLAHARERALERRTAAGVPPSATRRERRVLVLADERDGRRLGAENKRQVAEIVGGAAAGDRIVVRACHDVDGADRGARVRAVRVLEEIAAHGFPLEAVHVADCVPIAYRHVSATAPVAVELVRHGADPSAGGGT